MFHVEPIGLSLLIGGLLGKMFHVEHRLRARFCGFAASTRFHVELFVMLLDALWIDEINYFRS